MFNQIVRAVSGSVERHRIRAELLAADPERLATAVEAHAAEAERTLARSAAATQDGVLAGIAALAIDLRSAWLLWARHPEEGMGEAAAAASERLCRVLDPHGRSDLRDAVRSEAASIEASSLARLARMTAAGKRANPWGNDSPQELDWALRRGAVLVTTNPIMIDAACRAAPERWDPVRDAIVEDSAIEPARRAAELALRVVAGVACELRPIFEASDGAYGWVTYQVDPRAAGDAASMIDEAGYVHDRLTGELDAIPNVRFKLPGTEAGLDACSALAARAIGLVITASCSVAQHLAFAEVLERSAPMARTGPAGLLVMMNGRLDETVAAELAAAGDQHPESVARWASAAITRRSYALLRGRGCRRSALLVASLRGPWNIDTAITTGPEPVYFSCFPDRARAYEAAPRSLAAGIEDRVGSDILDRLARSRSFRLAFDPDAMLPARFAEHPTVAATLKSFAAARDALDRYTVSPPRI